MKILLLVLALCSSPVVVFSDWHHDVVIPSSESLSSDPYDDTAMLLDLSHGMQIQIQDISLQRQQRNLQGAQDPDTICEQYQSASKGLLTCNCSQYEATDVAIDCQYTNEICSTNMTTCVTQNVSIIIDKTGGIKGTRSCTRFTTSIQPRDVCIALVPQTVSMFNGSVDCKVTLNDEDCQSCGMCDFEEGGNITMSFDCCNVETDVKQTCGYVGPQGAAIPLFDTIPEDEQGKCGAGRSSSNGGGGGSNGSGSGNSAAPQSSNLGVVAGVWVGMILSWAVLLL
jgi:hypothetical protein